MPQNPRCAGIILCGGRSTRMGQDKAWLPFGPETMLQRIVRIVGTVTEPVVIVAAVEQALPQLRSDVQIVRDNRPQLGPMEGLRAGLAAVAPRSPRAFVTSCDVPLLKQELIQRIIELHDNRFTAAAPAIDGRYQPLTAVYSTELIALLDELLTTERRALRQIFEKITVRSIDPSELHDVDPKLESLMNLNSAEDYAAALRIAGL